MALIEKRTTAGGKTRYRARVRLRGFPEHTQKKVEATLKLWKGELGGLAVSNVTPARIVEVKERWLHENTRRGGPRSGSTVNRRLFVLSALFKTAMREWGWCDRNPVTLVSKSAQSRGVVRSWPTTSEKACLTPARPVTRNTSIP